MVVRVVRLVWVAAAAGAAKGHTVATKGDDDALYPWHQEKQNIIQDGKDLYDPTVR